MSYLCAQHVTLLIVIINIYIFYYTMLIIFMFLIKHYPIIYLLNASFSDLSLVDFPTIFMMVGLVLMDIGGTRLLQVPAGGDGWCGVHGSIIIKVFFGCSR